MTKTTKKILFFTGLSLDVIITIFLFVVSVIMLATMPQNSYEMDIAIQKNGQFIGYLQKNPIVYLCAFVVPLFVLLTANIVFLILYVRKVGKKSEVAVDDLTEEQKAALRAELLKELQNEEKPSEDSSKQE